MEFETFQTIVKDLYIYFRLKQQPEHGAVKQWFAKLNSIPDEAAGWIANWLKSEFDSMPWNIPKTFLKGWHIFKKENPEKIISEFKEQPCDDCGGRGILEFKKHYQDSGLRYNYVCRCGSCGNWIRHVGPLAMPLRLTLSELRNYDVEIVGRYDSQGVIKEDVCDPL